MSHYSTPRLAQSLTDLPPPRSSRLWGNQNSEAQMQRSSIECRARERVIAGRVSRRARAGPAAFPNQAGPMMRRPGRVLWRSMGIPAT